MSIPHWRYVDYTDDGCAAYECLNCYQQWEGRTSPGWFNIFEDLEEPTEDSWTSTSTGPNGEQIPRHYRKRDVPIYIPVWTYCPYCGVKWEGPIRCSDDNERMLGDRRRMVQDMVHARRREENYVYSTPDWWWWLEERTVWPDREDQEEWKVYCKMDPRKINAVRAHEILKQHREGQNTHESLFNTYEEARLVKKKQSDLEGVPWFRSVYERH